MTRTCQFYAVGYYKVGKIGLVAYDEMCVESGEYFTDDPFMCNRYTYGEMLDEMRVQKASGSGMTAFLVTITKDERGHSTNIEGLDVDD
jgi:hypothetical protein